MTEPDGCQLSRKSSLLGACFRRAYRKAREMDSRTNPRGNHVSSYNCSSGLHQSQENLKSGYQPLNKTGVAVAQSRFVATIHKEKIEEYNSGLFKQLRKRCQAARGAMKTGEMTRSPGLALRWQRSPRTKVRSRCSPLPGPSAMLARPRPTSATPSRCCARGALIAAAVPAAKQKGPRGLARGPRHL